MELLFESRPNIIATSGKLRFFQRSPEIHPAPVFEPQSLVDGAGTSLYGTVMREGGIFRMWYQAWPRDWDGSNCNLVGYAESDDGVEWRRPVLNLVDHASRGKENNLVSLNGHAPSVFIDPDAPSTHRYRATVCAGSRKADPGAGVGGYGYYTAHSADGLSWEFDRTTPQWKHADVITGIYHPDQRRGIVALKVTPRVNGIPRRSIWNAELIEGRWTDASAALLPDEFDDVASVARGYASGDYYGMGMMPAGSGTVGFLWQFRHSLPRTAGSGAGVFGNVDVSLVYQGGRADRWLHVPGRPDFISHSDVPWGNGCVYTSSSPVEVDDEQRLYFSGSLRQHGWYLNERWEIDEDLKQTRIKEGLSRIGFARWPKWRLFGFRSEPRGELDLNLGPRAGSTELSLNYRCEAGGSVRVEVLDCDGYGLGESVPLTGDVLSANVAWSSGRSIPASGQADRVVRLHLDRAEVYAYQATLAGAG